MNEGSRRKLESLLERKRKVEALTISEKTKWKKEIDKLNKEINETRIELEMIEWDEYKAINILREANFYLSSTFSWTSHHMEFNEFLKDNPQLLKAVKEVDISVDEAFYKKDMEEVIKAVESYRDTYGRVNRIWRDYAAQDGFREVLDIEEGYLQNPWSG